MKKEATAVEVWGLRRLQNTREKAKQWRQTMVGVNEKLYEALGGRKETMEKTEVKDSF
jgi:hypothetical protein